MKTDILKWKFKTKIAILTPKLQNYVKIIDQTQISTIQDHSKLIYLSHNSLFLSLRSSQNINICTGPPCSTLIRCFDKKGVLIILLDFVL